MKNKRLPKKVTDTFLKVFADIRDYVLEDSRYFSICAIVDVPRGQRQESDCPLFDHEYVEQSCGIAGDDFSGYIYLPFGEKYLQIEFSS